ncbi:hypothetical protein HK414_06160 [Ramlibacter terrae]|uniref:Uncharacterized protein n=1 Tax=Ramlibacter terrae TaxID=2732511 RepID=A0ABX6P2K3_9BURK|nr:hypothetical protein HK414_06160 [Ramlibacter terrae]
MGLLLAAGFAAGAQAACELPHASAPNVRTAVQKAGAWPISDEKCNFLRANNLFLQVSGMATVLSGVSVGWAEVSIVDQNNIRSDKSHASTKVDKTAGSIDAANKLMVDAIRESINGLDFQLAAREVAEYRRKAK